MWFAVSVLFFFLIIQTLLGVSSLRSGFAFLRFVQEGFKTRPREHDIEIAVFVPCKGLEEGLYENLKAIVNQSIKAKVVFIVESEDDPATNVIRDIEGCELFVAGKTRDSGQKVHNLIETIEKKDMGADVYVFADSDARPDEDWLLNLIDPLFGGNATVSTGYRWFAPSRFSIASQLRSVWNASITSSLGPDGSSNFCWGGSMAIRREDFERLNVAERWRRTVSDDFVLTNIVKEADGHIHFVPNCLNASTDVCGLRDFLEFAVRQMKITRVYSPNHFKISLIGSVLFTLTFLGGILSLFYLSGLTFWIAATLLLIIWICGTGKALVRYAAVRMCIREYMTASGYIWHAIFWPVGTFVFLLADIAAILSRKIVWRGIRYELVSDKETRIG